MTTEMKVLLPKLFSSYFQVVSSYFQVIFKLFSSAFLPLPRCVRMEKLDGGKVWLGLS